MPPFSLPLLSNLLSAPVHYFLIRHVYFPCLRRKISRPAATFVVFLLSAVMHEVLVSVPFHMIRPWSFLGMLGQIPLVTLTKQLERKYPGSSLGNVIFWISFCVVGQPMAILLYTIDWKARKKNQGTDLELFSSQMSECRIMRGDRCLIR
jgi:diacylglycerol O-acyltransferase 1